MGLIQAFWYHKQITIEIDNAWLTCSAAGSIHLHRILFYSSYVFILLYCTFSSRSDLIFPPGIDNFISSHIKHAVLDLLMLHVIVITNSVHTVNKITAEWVNSGLKDKADNHL